MDKELNSWTVFFMFKPFTTIHTTFITEEEFNYKDERLVEIARQKIIDEMNIDVYGLAEKLGKNDNFGSGWISVEDNQDASERELKILKPVK